MITHEIIEEVKKRLVQEFDPREIYLFGSYASGKPDEESDLDVAIILDDYPQNRHEALVESHRALLGINVPKEIVIYTKKDFDKYSEDITRLCHTIKMEGKKIYAKA